MAITIVLAGENSPGKTTLLKSFVQGAACQDDQIRSAMTLNKTCFRGDHEFKIWDLASSPPFEERDFNHYAVSDAIIICVEDNGNIEATKAYINKMIELADPECKIYLALTKTDLNYLTAMNAETTGALLDEIPRIARCYRVSSHKYVGVEDMFVEIANSQLAQVALEPVPVDRFSVDGVNTIDQLKDALRQRFNMDDEGQHANIAKYIGLFIGQLPEDDDDLAEGTNTIEQLFKDIGIGQGNQSGTDPYLSRLRLRTLNRWSDPAYRETNDSGDIAKKGKEKAKRLLTAAGDNVDEATHDQCKAIFYVKSERVDFFNREFNQWYHYYYPIAKNNGMLDRDFANDDTDMIGWRDLRVLKKAPQYMRV